MSTTVPEVNFGDCPTFHCEPLGMGGIDGASEARTDTAVLASAKAGMPARVLIWHDEAVVESIGAAVL